MESPRWALGCYFDGLSDNRALQSTSWSNLSLQVYTRASSYEWALQKYPLSRSFFECHAPFSSSQPRTLYHRQPQDLPLWLPRWRNQMLWTLHRALPRTWSRSGKRSSCGTWKLAGISLLVTLHLSQPWVLLFHPRTWAPTRCGSWVPLTTERHHGLSVRPDQNEQTAASVRTVDPARGLLLTDIGPGSDTAKCLLTPPPTRRLSPVQTRFTLYYTPATLIDNKIGKTSSRLGGS